MKKPLFQGTCTALVTPFANGHIDKNMLKKLLIRQTEAGISAIVIAGTTGEAPTLSDDEKAELFTASKEIAGSSLKIIAGTGSNCTAHAVRLSQAAQQAGADGLLVVSPYYNKATEAGILAHYRAIAAATSLPIILYNVPSRTGLDIPVSVCRQLAEIPNIIGIKEACPSISKIGKILAECPPDFYVWSGNDEMAVPVMAMGGKGVISVTSNILPRKVNAMTNEALKGNYAVASRICGALQPLNELLFGEVNPIPAKAMLELMGLPCGGCRLPLTDISHEKRELMKEFLQHSPLFEDENLQK